MGLASSIALAGLSVVNPDPNALKTAKQVVVLTQKELNELTTQLVNPENTANFNDFVKQKNNEGKDLEGGSDGDPTFSIANGVLKVEGGNSELQKAVDTFNNLQNQNLKTTTLKYIQQVMDDDSLQDRQKNMLIASFVQVSLGENAVIRGKGNAKYTPLLEKIAELAGFEMNVDEDGNIFTLTTAQLNLAQKYGWSTEQASVVFKDMDLTVEDFEEATQEEVDDVTESIASILEEKRALQKDKQENEKKYQTLSEKQKEESNIDQTLSETEERIARKKAELKRLKEGKGN